LKTKAKIFQDIIIDVREKHRLMCVEMREQLKELEKPFIGLRMAFKAPKTKNRTYKIKALEFKHLSVLPINSRKRKSTEFISICSNASFFGYALNEVKLDFVKMQSDGFDKELLTLERKLHQEFSNKTRAMILSAEVDMIANKIFESDADFFLASKAYHITNLNNTSRHTGKIIKLEYNPFMAEINTIVYSDTQKQQIIDNEQHIVNIWD
tara:strand:- start:1025 stop:1654 length:630 start_codon:yes stop_codon:yes gene_type:complete